MPLYDYRCTACGREVEVMHGINDRGPEACEACGGAMRKALSPPAIHFKGSGWAKKDAASAAKAKPKADTAGGKGSSEDDSKPASGDSSTGDTTKSTSSGSEATTTAAPSGGTKTE